MDALSLTNWGVVAALAAPHILYAFIWCLPDLWMKVFKKKSVDVFGTVAWLLKSA